MKRSEASSGNATSPASASNSPALITPTVRLPLQCEEDGIVRDCPSTAVPSPSLVGSVCHNVVRQVTYLRIVEWRICQSTNWMRWLNTKFQIVDRLQKNFAFCFFFIDSLSRYIHNQHNGGDIESRSLPYPRIYSFKCIFVSAEVFVSILKGSYTFVFFQVKNTIDVCVNVLFLLSVFKFRSEYNWKKWKPGVYCRIPSNFWKCLHRSSYTIVRRRPTF